MIITLKGADFSKSNIGTLEACLVSLSIGVGAKYDIPSHVIKGTGVTWVITLDDGYIFGDYSVTMGNEAITPVVDGNRMTINIASVTGDITINVETSNESIEDLGLDTIAYDGKTFRQLFINNNAAPDINNNSMQSAVAGAFSDSSGTTSIVSDTSVVSDNYVPPYSLKVTGTSSQQARSTSYFPKTDRWFMAANVNVTSYTEGYCGVIFSSDFSGCINRKTNGWEVVAGITAGESTADGSGVFIGSASSANLTGYINNPVAINLNIFTTTPNLEELRAVYMQYTALLKAGKK